MSAELDHVASDFGALVFSLGAIATAVAERFHAQPFSEAARAMLTVALMALGLFHLGCALDGVRVLTGGTDPFYTTLVASNLSAAARWREVTPLLTAILMALAGANLLAAQFALRNVRAGFAASMTAVLFAAVAMAMTVAAAIGFTDGHRTFLSIVAAEGAMAALLWRFGMRPFSHRRS